MVYPFVSMATGDNMMYFKLCNTLHVLMCYAGIVIGIMHSLYVCDKLPCPRCCVVCGFVA